MLTLDARGPNTARLAAEIARLNERLAEELAAANEQIGLRVSGTAKRIMQDDIYNVPIPLKAGSERSLSVASPLRQKTTKGKHGKWLRTGNLKRVEGYRVEGGRRVILVNTANYSVPRHDLGLPGHRKVRSVGVRSVQWQEEAVKREEPFIKRTYEQAISRALGRTVTL